ncbi:MAG: tetratricopeptide repeat protein [Pseudomonadota bacterium]
MFFKPKALPSALTAASLFLACSVTVLTPVYAQNAEVSVRVIEMEERIRSLNGKVEELTFQLLQMQEQMRKMQEDNELRFQELEEKSSSATPDGSNTKAVAGGTDSLEKPLPSESADASDGTNKPAQPVETAAIDDAPTAATSGINSDALTLENAKTPASTPDPDGAKSNTPNQPAAQVGGAPRSLGTLTFDANGNVINAGRPEFSDEKMTKLPGVFSDGVDGGVEAAEYGPTPSTVLKAGQIALKNNRLNRAEGAFRAFLKAWPKDPDIALAKTYLAQALFQKQQYFDAANLFLDTHNAHPESRAGADNLLGLGLSLAGLNQREVACATYAEVLKQYPADAERLRERVSTEQSAARC